MVIPRSLIKISLVLGRLILTWKSDGILGVSALTRRNETDELGVEEA